MIYGTIRSKKTSKLIFTEEELNGEAEDVELDTIEDLRSYAAKHGDHEVLIIFDPQKTKGKAKPKAKSAAKPSAKTTAKSKEPIKPKAKPLTKPNSKTAQKKSQ